jgi:hypothetical protein
LSGPRAALQNAERATETFHSGGEILPGFRAKFADRSQVIQQLERVPEVFTGRFRVGVSRRVAPTFEVLRHSVPRRRSARFHNSRETEPRTFRRGGNPLVRAASTVGKQAP